MAGPIPTGPRRQVDPAKAAALKTEQERYAAVAEARAEHEARKAHMHAVDIELRRMKDFKARNHAMLGLDPATLTPHRPTQGNVST